MKKILKFGIALLLLFPAISYAQFTASQGGTGLSTYTSGDIIYAASTNPIRFTKLNIGANTTCLKSDGSFPLWGSCSAGSGSGTWATSTNSAYGGVFNNYSLNATDIVEIGGTPTTSAKYWFDPNVNPGTGTSTAFFSGNTGFGTTSPTAPVSIQGANGNDNILLQTWSYGGGALNARTYNLRMKQSITSNVVRYCFDQRNNNVEFPNTLCLDRGRIGIGTSTPFAQLSVVGSTGVLADHYVATGTVSNIFPYASTTALSVDTSLFVNGNSTLGTVLSGTWNGSAIGFGFGGTGVSSAADDSVLVSNGSSWIESNVPNCIDTGGQHLNYTSGSNAFSCGNSGGGGGGGGTGGGTWSTTTSQVTGEYINYPNNNTDIVTIGGSATSSAKVQFDPNLGFSKFGNTIPIQLDPFGTKPINMQIDDSVNDGVGIDIFNRSPSSLATSFISLVNNNAPLGGPGASAPYSCSFVMAGGGWNGSPIGFGSLLANDGVTYCTDGNLLLAAPTTSPSHNVGNVKFFTGFAGSFNSGNPDVIISDLGFLGVGTNTPYAALSVVGNTGVIAQQYMATSSTATSTFTGSAYVGPATAAVAQFNVKNNGKLNVIDLRSTADLSIATLSNAGTFNATSITTGSTAQGSSQFNCTASATCTFTNAQAGASQTIVRAGTGLSGANLTFRTTSGASDNGGFFNFMGGVLGQSEFMRLTPASSTINIGVKLPPGGSLMTLAASSTGANPIFRIIGNTPANIVATSTLFQIDSYGVMTGTSTPPALSGCGTSPTQVSTGNWGEVSAGATATGCTGTFANGGFANTASCVITPQTGSIANTFSYTVSKTAFVVTETGLGGNKFNFRCDGN